MNKKLLLGALFVVLMNNVKADIINSDYTNNEIIKGELIGLEVVGSANLMNDGVISGNNGVANKDKNEKIGDINNTGIILGYNEADKPVGIGYGIKSLADAKDNGSVINSGLIKGEARSEGGGRSVFDSGVGIIKMNVTKNAGLIQGKALFVAGSTLMDNIISRNSGRELVVQKLIIMKE